MADHSVPVLVSLMAVMMDCLPIKCILGSDDGKLGNDVGIGDGSKLGIELVDPTAVHREQMLVSRWALKMGDLWA